MEIVVTDWALQSYLELNHLFSEKEYREILRPDMAKLKVKIQLINEGRYILRGRL